MNTKKMVLLILSALIGVIGVAQGLHWTDIVSPSTAATITGALGFLAVLIHAIETSQTGGSNTTQAHPAAVMMALAFAVMMAGCAQTSNWGAGVAAGLHNVFFNVNTVQAEMQTPEAQQAIATLKAIYRGTVCGLSAGSAFIQEIAVDVKATATVNGTAIVMAISKTACTGAGGVVGQ